MKKKVLGVFLIVAGVLLLGFLLWSFWPDQYGISPHPTSRETQAGVELGILTVVLLVSGVLLTILPKRKVIKKDNNAKE